MADFDHIRSGMGRAWDTMLEGWQQLRERASQALTRFRPHTQGGELETLDEQVMEHSAGWGLLTAEVLDSEDQVVVKLEAPGMEPQDFAVAVEGDHLIVSGEKRASREDRRGRYYLMESAYGRFERAVPLPASVDESQAKAQYRRGVLRVTLPKLEAGKGRKISVETG